MIVRRAMGDSSWATIRRVFRRTTFLAALAALGLALAVPPHTARGADVVFPGKTWQTKAPEELGLDPARLDAVAVSLGGRGCIIKDGYVVKSWGPQDEKSDWFSSAKPVLSTLLFFAIQEGKVESVDTKIASFGWPLIPKDQTMTFRHLADMTSGYARPEAPGAAWSYNDFAIQLYQKTLFDKVFREDPATAANSPERFGKIGLEDGLAFRESNRRISASVRDFARIAWLWLNRGNWDGKPVLAERFFVDYMRPDVPKDLPNTEKAETNDYLRIGSYGGGSDHFSKAGPGIYGFNWWYNSTGRGHPDSPTWPGAPAETVMSLGFGGNCTALIPSQRLLVVAANADWGKNDPGNADGVMNHRLKQIAYAGTPIPAEKPSAPSAQRLALDAAKAHVSGELKKWHRVTLSFAGPETSETATPNPFRDYRLNVTFTNGGTSLVVPGYYAADGNAAETGAEAGNCWRVHFAPPETGNWSWKASFRTGTDVAMDPAEDAGKPIAFDGQSGTLEIGPTDKTGLDLRAQGALRYDGTRYLVFAENKKRFLKNGADSPENFLAYHEFDNTKPTHKFGPHALDHRPDDPLWRGSKGKNIFGSLNYLASKGINSFYFLTMNVRGDGKDVWPWLAETDKFHYDCSKLDQWEIVFTHMDKLGIVLHAVHQEQENDQLLDKGELGPERRLYYRELIARFAHHPGVVWNLGEENTNTDDQRRAFGKFFHDVDPYDHAVVVHTFPSKIDVVYTPLLGDPNIEGASLQTNKTRRNTKKWIESSAAAGRQWVVSLDEIGPADTGVKPDFDDYEHDEVRTEHLWPHFVSGGAGVEWLFGYKYAHHDIGLEDFRSRDHMWDLTRIAVDFFQEHLPFTEMHSADDYVNRAEACCFAKPGQLYAVYIPDGKETELWLPKATYSVRWFNPRKGGKLRTGSVEKLTGDGFQKLGSPPSDSGKDCLAVVKLEGPVPADVPVPPARK